MKMAYLTQELKKDVELQHQHAEAFLKMIHTTGDERNYFETVVLPAIEKDQEYQKIKVDRLLEQALKEQNERCKANQSQLH